MPPGDIARARQNDDRRKHERSFRPVGLHLPLNSRGVLAHLGGRLLVLVSIFLCGGSWHRPQVFDSRHQSIATTSQGLDVTRIVGGIP